MSRELAVTGTVYCDMNVDGKMDSGDQGIAGVTVTLSGTDAYGNAISETTTTNSAGVYSFAGMPFSNASGYTVSVTTPSGDFSGTATVGSLGGSAASNPEAVNAIVMATSSHTSGTGYNFGLLMPSSLSGEVYDDGKNDCQQDAGDQGLAGVTVTLTGKNYQGTSVSADGPDRRLRRLLFQRAGAGDLHGHRVRRPAGSPPMPTRSAPSAARPTALRSPTPRSRRSCWKGAPPRASITTSAWSVPARARARRRPHRTGAARRASR